MRTRAAGIVIRDNKILLMKRVKNGRLYYTIPGGSVEEGETNTGAAEREVYEETRVQMRVIKLLYRHEFDTGEVQEYYLCKYLSGEPRLEESEESAISSETNSYEPLFIPISKLADLPIVPPKIKERLLEAVPDRFPDRPETIKLKAAEQLSSFY